MLPVTTHALNFNLSADTIDPNAFGAGKPGWSSGSTALPAGTTIGSTPLFLDVFLSHLLNANGSLSFGLGGISPPVTVGDVAFTFSLQLFFNGMAIAPASGFTVTNSFSFPIDNIRLSYSDPNTAGKNYNEIQISVTSPANRTVTSFNTAVGIPEPGTTSLILIGAFGLAGAGLSRASDVGALPLAQRAA